MQCQRGELVPIGEAMTDLGGPVKAIREASPQAQHHFTVAEARRKVPLNTRGAEAPRGSYQQENVRDDERNGMEAAKIAHLQMIQAVITRMAGNAFLIKGWSITLVVALFALGAANTNELFVYLAYFPTFMFWALDAYFLRQERLFRKLYDHVRTTEDGPVDFSMNTQPFAENADGTWSVAWSHTLRLFHGTITGTVLVVMLLLVLT